MCPGRLHDGAARRWPLALAWRAFRRVTVMDAAAEDMFVPVERALAGSTLADFEVRRKIGGKDIMPGGLQQTVTQHGVCSYVYEVVSMRPAAAATGAFALKVMSYAWFRE